MFVCMRAFILATGSARSRRFGLPFFLLSGEPFLDRLVWTLKYKDHGGTGTAIDFEEDKGKASLIVAFFLVGAVALTLERENEYICFRFEYVLRSFFSVSVEQIHN